MALEGHNNEEKLRAMYFQYRTPFLLSILTGAFLREQELRMAVSPKIGFPPLHWRNGDYEY